MREELLRAMPEFDQIGDVSLKGKVVAVWLEALRRGGWTVEDLNRMPFTLLVQPCAVSILDHNRGVVKGCLQMADVFKEVYGDKMVIDRDVLVAGALLHDVGKLLEFREADGAFATSRLGKLLRHPISGAALCLELGLPEEVVHLVAAHSKEGDQVKRTPEAVILHHTDRINFEAIH